MIPKFSSITDLTSNHSLVPNPWFSLSGRIVERTNIEQRLAALPKPGSPEVGEDGPPSTSLLFKNGRASVIASSSHTLEEMDLIPYPHLHLTTQHALTITRALATLHANSSSEGADRRLDGFIGGGDYEVKDKYMYSKCPAAMYAGEKECPMAQIEECNGECGDVLTAEVTQNEVARANLSILTDRLRSNADHTNIVRHLDSLETDLGTLMEFIQFSSAVSKKWVASVGPISACDIWINENDEDQIAIRLRGGTSLRAPPLRDAAWIWLTLIDPETLRTRYTELCDEYCNAFNAAHHRLTAAPGQPVEEIISYFDVMRDLGESFLHAFFTFLHKFTVSGTWYLDRKLYEEEGIARTAAIIQFLIENGIVGNIFIGWLNAIR